MNVHATPLLYMLYMLTHVTLIASGWSPKDWHVMESVCLSLWDLTHFLVCLEQPFTLLASGLAFPFNCWFCVYSSKQMDLMVDYKWGV